MPVPERLTHPDEESRLGREHLGRYRFAVPRARGRVLDLACGSGYGSALLLQGRRVSSVVAADRSAAALDLVRTRRQELAEPGRLEIVQVDAEDPALPQQLGCFDTIVSFETLEHLHDDLRMLASCRQMLRPAGCLLISTPLGRGRGIPSGDPFHVRQFTWSELQELLAAHFAVLAWYGQDGGAVERPQVGRSYRVAVAICGQPKGTDH